MFTELRITNARIVTPSEIVEGDLSVVDGQITEVEPSATVAPGALDFEGDYLIPGLVDLHTDNLERHYQPRPGTTWDALGAALAHDGQVSAAGITTVFDSLSLHGVKDGLDRGNALPHMIEAVEHAGEDGLLRADHFLHLRCEVTNPELLALLEPHRGKPDLKLISVMDHTPGQRQMRNFDREEFRARLIDQGTDPAEVDAMMARWMDAQDQGVVPKNREAVVAFAREYDVPLAAHDEETVEHIHESAADGVTIAEFPVTLDAAKCAHDEKMMIVMGAPNLVRGESHSGNISAGEIAEAGLLDILASDYIPLSMLRAAFVLTQPKYGFTLPQAVATVTANPARAVGLKDRGEISPDRRADLVRVSVSERGWPIVRGVWRAGERVA